MSSTQIWGSEKAVNRRCLVFSSAVRKYSLSIILALFLLGSVLLTAGCGKGSGSGKDGKGEYKEKSAFLMGTLIQARVYGDNAEEIIKECFDRISAIEGLMSINIPGTEIDKVNRNAGMEEVSVSPESFYVLGKAMEYAEITGGRFDPTVGPLVKLWGIGTENARVPAPEEIKDILRLVGYQKLRLDPSDNGVYLEEAGMIVDLGAIAKGYAADEVAAIFKKHNVESAFVSLGGNVYVHGRKPNGNRWRIGIQDPRSYSGDYMGVIEVEDIAIVTSGDYERFFEKDGVRYHHILDTKTGYPADSGLISVTILCGSSIDADALSTSLFVLGLEEGMKLAESLEGVEAIFITGDKKVYLTSGIRDKLELTDKGYTIADL